MSQKLGRSTYRFNTSPSFLGFAAVAGKKESEGPLGRFFDMTYTDDGLGQKTWEKAESQMQKDAVTKAMEKAHCTPDDIDAVFAGDLLNQNISSHYGLRSLNIPFIGLYGACSTMAESLNLASLYVDNGLAEKAMAVTSSHFCTAERQFRFPLEYGGQRAPTTQWTATAAGSVVIGHADEAPYVRAMTTGKIVDLGVTDINNMGGAMAPAAADTIKQYLTDTCTTPSHYDLIVTGDLGQIGSKLLVDLLLREKIDISMKHQDCGLILFDQKTQDVHSGASGCGCSAAVLCSYLLNRIQDGTYDNILFVATGALMSTTSIQQKESIPSIAHLTHISRTKWEV